MSKMACRRAVEILLIALYLLQNAYFLKIKLVQPRKACFSSRKASWVATTKLFQEEQARNLGKRRLSSGSLRSRTEELPNARFQAAARV